MCPAANRVVTARPCDGYTDLGCIACHTKPDFDGTDEFERILNQVNALEMDALKQGNGFSPKVDHRNPLPLPP